MNLLHFDFILATMLQIQQKVQKMTFSALNDIFCTFFLEVENSCIINLFIHKGKIKGKNKNSQKNFSFF